MARKRMIDPNIWQSEDFSNLKTLSKLIFIGLFSLADDEGYGRANPTLIKTNLFPFDEKLRTTDIEASLKEIATNMSIVFYTAEDGKNYYYLKSWDKWQTIQKPSKSKLPKLNDSCTVILQDNYSSDTVGLQPKEREENKNKKEEKRTEEKRTERNLTLSEDSVRPSDVQKAVQQVTQKWNELEGVGIKAVSRISQGTQRYDFLRARIKEYGVDRVIMAVEKIKDSDFLQGKSKSNWVINFDWFVRPNNFIKVLEGNYDRRGSQGGGNSNREDNGTVF